MTAHRKWLRLLWIELRPSTIRQHATEPDFEAPEWRQSKLHQVLSNHHLARKQFLNFRHKPLVVVMLIERRQ